MYVLLALTLVFTQLSLLAFGGGNAILPEMQHQVVTVHHWMTAEQFSSMFAMAQAAPGPNMMIVPLVLPFFLTSFPYISMRSIKSCQAAFTCARVASGDPLLSMTTCAKDRFSSIGSWA